MINEIERNAPCTKRSVNVSRDHLPLSCPPANERIWDAHPRIYLPIEEKKQIECPYCGTQYLLTD